MKISSYDDYANKMHMIDFAVNYAEMNDFSKNLKNEIRSKLAEEIVGIIMRDLEPKLREVLSNG